MKKIIILISLLYSCLSCASENLNNINTKPSIDIDYYEIRINNRNLDDFKREVSLKTKQEIAKYRNIKRKINILLKNNTQDSEELLFSKNYLEELNIKTANANTINKCIQKTGSWGEVNECLLGR